MFSLLDPARPEVPDAVLKARSAHIRVAMVTGDHPTTAKAIGNKVNILTKEISIDGGIDSFRAEYDDRTGETVAYLMRNTDTLLETHTISEIEESIDVKGIKTTSRQRKKSNVFKRLWARFLFYFKDPNEIKEVNKLELIPYGIVVAGGDMHFMDVSQHTQGFAL